MIEAESREYRPDYAIPPGETVRSTLEALGMTQSDLSRRTGLSAKHINQIIQGSAPITPDTALALERVLGVPARFWNALEANHQARLVRLRESVVSAEDDEWLGRLPVKELVQWGLIRPTADRGELRDRVLAFFGVATREAWDSVWRAPDVAFRRSKVFEADPYATAAWLRIGEIEATGEDAEPFSRARFIEVLQEIRGMMRLEPEAWEPELKRLAKTAGVVVVIHPEVKKSRVNGATRWLSPTKALIQLSLRYHWEDIFWFSFFHEAGHVLLHGKRDAFIDDGQEPSAQEDEANEFAANLLIPRGYERHLLRVRTLAEARALALQLGIPPGIVVGRLQREGIFEYKVGNGLRRKFDSVAG